MLRSLALALLLLASPAFAQQPADLLPGPGRDATATFCGTCHTANYIRMDSVFLTPDEWKAEVTKMRQVFGAPINDATAETIIKYLSSTYARPAKR